VRQRISELTVSEVSAGRSSSWLSLPSLRTSRSRHDRFSNGLLAFFASLFLAVLIALGRDLLVPRAGSARELSRLLNLPVLAGIPYVSRRFNRRRTNMLTAVATEAYQTLQASVRFELPPDRQRVILVSSALEGEGKTHVSAGLGRALARVGHKTLVVCADLRFPTLHDQFGLARAAGALGHPRGDRAQRRPARRGDRRGAQEPVHAHGRPATTRRSSQAARGRRTLPRSSSAPPSMASSQRSPGSTTRT
jgi:hypothetical protein